MISYHDACQLISDNVSQLEDVVLPIKKAGGYVSYLDIVAPFDVIPFRNSAMDGLAVATKAIKSYPAKLPVVGTVFAGVKKLPQGNSHSAMKIMTGAPVPDEYDAVVKFEDVIIDHNHVTITNPVKTGQNIRQPGEDFKQGEKLISKGELIHSFYIGILASIGLSKVKVFQKPRVLVAGTGDELIEPGETLTFGKIYNSNCYTISSMIEPFCSKIDIIPKVNDKNESLQPILNTDYDMIITSGGVSAGEKDLLVASTQECGWMPIFHKVAIKPGKPVYFAGKDNCLLFGLPGNPLSAAVTCAVFIVPALKKMMGNRHYEIHTTSANLINKHNHQNERTVIWPGKFRNENGRLVAETSFKHSSSALSTLIGSDGLIFQFPECRKNLSSPHTEFATWQQILNR